MAHAQLSPDMIADIYEAAVDDERWPRMAEIVGAAGKVAGTAVWIVEHGKVLELSVTDELLATREPYLAHYSKLDPWQAGLLNSPTDRVWLGYETAPERDVAKTEFYNDFARPNGILRPMGAMMRLGPATLATVAANRPVDKAIFEETDKRRLQTLVPHLRRALQLRLTHRRRAPQERMQAAALDALAFGILVCDRTGRILLANRAAEALARAGAGIVLGQRSLSVGALAPSEAKILAAFVHDAANGGPGGVMRLTGRRGIAELSVLVSPLPGGFGLGDSRNGHALVTLRTAWDIPSFTARTLSALFGLSPAQAAIALAIFDGKAPEVIAAERGVTISTLRTHLAEIFARTGVENQRGLVRLLGTLPPVRADRPQ